MVSEYRRSWLLIIYMQKGYPVDLAVYSDPGPISQRLPVIKQITQKLMIPHKV